MEVILLPVLHMITNFQESKLKTADRPIIYFNADNKSTYEDNQLEQNAKITSRKHQGHLQLLTKDIHNLLIHHLPDDAYCVIGLTMVDLYPQESWNFVFGQASLRARVGVFSFARYTPYFWSPKTNPVLTVAEKCLLLFRSCKVMAHETVHMFGISHCLYFDCLMNGSNNLEESDRHPIFLCPVDLHKLHHVLKFNVLDRYLALQQFFQSINKETKIGFQNECEWIEKRIAEIIQIQIETKKT